MQLISTMRAGITSNYIRQLASIMIIVVAAFYLCIVAIDSIHRHVSSRSSTGQPTLSRQHNQAKAPSVEWNRNFQHVIGDKMTFKSKQGRCNDGSKGKIGVAVIYVTESYQTHYKVAQQTLYCYINRTGYELILIDLKTDELVMRYCRHDQLFFRKHCAASLYTKYVDWLFVLDADTGVVNPNNCIEDYIDERVDLIFYERFFNWEVASGNYIARNSDYARKFLMDWADWQFDQPQNFNGADNGVLQLHLLNYLLPEAQPEIDACDATWHNASGYDTYMNFVTCCKVVRGGQHVWPGKVLIYRRAHGWVIDWYMTNEQFCDKLFMFHGWKNNEIGAGGWKSPFSKVPSGKDCEPFSLWPYREHMYTSCSTIRKMLAQSEINSARGFPKEARDLWYLNHPDIGKCWPDCHTDVLI